MIKEAKNRVSFVKEESRAPYNSNSSNEESAVEFCERVYPQTTEEFKKILDEMYVTFCRSKGTTDLVTFQLELH